MMRTAIGPFIVAAAVAILIGLGVKLDPWFPGDVAAARAVQSALPDPQPWALPVSALAPPPARYVVVGVAILASIWICLQQHRRMVRPAPHSISQQMPLCCCLSDAFSL